MTARDFCYWLQGLFELGAPGHLTPQQTDLVKRHLALVFKHDIDSPDPTGELQATHDGTKPPRPTIGGSGPDGTLYRC